MRSYRTKFVVAVIGNVVLAAALLFLWLHFVLGPRRGGSANAAAPSSANAANSSGAISPAANAEANSMSGSMGVSGTDPTATPSAALGTPEAALVPVQISPERLQRIGVKIGEVERKQAADEIPTTGNVAVDETRLAYVQVRFSGYIEKVFADATYQYVRKGQPLFTIYSPDLVATEREYLVAKQNQRQVAQSTISGVAESAASLLDAAAERLKQWGVPPNEIARLEFSGQVRQELEIDSPVSGYITERNALPNLTVQPDTRLYTIADLSTVWVQAQVFQNDLGRIKPGDPATLTANTFPGRNFAGRIDFIYPQVDMTTRTASVRIVFANPGLQLKPGMFVNVTLKAPLGKQIVIPATGVLQTGTRNIAFVERGDGYIEPREIELGERVGDDFIVLKGLKAGEQIVTSANFLIDSESQLQAALGSFAPPPPGAGAASAMNAPHANVDLSTDPNPARKGGNTFHVKLTDSKGAPILGAQVTVTLFMAAMPAMGMAAMRTSVTLSDKGNGVYEGAVELGNGGTWQTTIVATKNGQAIASKQIDVRATGGM